LALVLGVIALRARDPRIDSGVLASPATTLARGDTVPLNDLLSVPESSEASLHFPDGSSAKLESGTRLRITRRTGSLALERGTADFQVRPRPSDDHFTVETQEAVVEVVGTRFEVTRDDVSTTIVLSSGKIRVRNLLQGGETYLEAPASLRIGPPVATAAPAAAANEREPATKAESESPKVSAAQIRSQVAKGRIAAARALLERARAEGTRAQSDAELAIVEAEVLFAEGKVRLAARA
jgi:hypothetical protein